MRKEEKWEIETELCEVSGEEYAERLSELVALLIHFEAVRETIGQVCEHIGQEAA